MAVGFTADFPTCSWMNNKSYESETRPTTNIVRVFMTDEEMREANERVHRKIQEARRITTYKRSSRKSGNNPADTYVN